MTESSQHHTETDPASDAETQTDTATDTTNDGQPDTPRDSRDTDEPEPEPESEERCRGGETVDQATREAVLAEYDRRCQSCGQRDPDAGGLAALEVHHIERDPAEYDEHDLDNLTLYCRSCHRWLHQQSTPDEAPVALSDADRSTLLPQDIDILRYLAANGPARTGDIASGLPADHSVSAVRERLWVLMGLDNRVESREEQVVDKDIETGEWGLADQVEASARGHIPDDPHLFVQRMEDEQVRRALDRGCDRSAVTDVLGIARRTSFDKRKRAYAFDFPLETFRRASAESATTDRQPQQADEETAEDSAPTQRRLQPNGDEPDDRDDAADESAAERARDTESTQTASAPSAETVRQQLSTAIDALTQLEEQL